VRFYPRLNGIPKQSEITGRFVGFSHDIGHKLTFLVLTDDTKSVISRSRVTLIKTEENDLKLDDDFGKLRNRVYVRSRHDGKEDWDTADMPGSGYEAQGRS
jgi:hypothetical protein